ncbi:unnamed protein product, partial [Oreochromis niloticus]
MWNCKLCSFSTAIKVMLLKHYRLNHGQYSTISPLPCLYNTCMCTFSTFNSLKIHMSRMHTPTQRKDGSYLDLNNYGFCCPVCNFKQPFIESQMFIHLRGHLKRKETVPCPFKNCNFKTNVYSTFNAHKCRDHQNSTSYDEGIVQSVINVEQKDDMQLDSIESSDDNQVASTSESSAIEGLEEQLQYNLAGFFLKMQTILHVSQRATQEIIEHINQLFLLSQPLVRKSVIDILKKHNCTYTDKLVDEICQAVSDSNVLHKCVTSEGPLSTAKRRKSHYEANFPYVKPVEYLIESSKHTYMYVPILTSLQLLLKKNDVLEEIKQAPTQIPGHFMSFCDGSYYQENVLLSQEGQKLSIILYVDDFEITNPLGTSKKIH